MAVAHPRRGCPGHWSAASARERLPGVPAAAWIGGQMSESTAASRSETTHGVDLCYFNGESWRVICECGWEVWDQEREEVARNWHAKHAAAETWDEEVEVTTLLRRSYEVFVGVGFQMTHVASCDKDNLLAVLDAVRIARSEG